MKCSALSSSARCVWKEEIRDDKSLEMERCDEKRKASHYRYEENLGPSTYFM